MSAIGDDVQSVCCAHTISRPDDKIKWAIIEAAPRQIERQLDGIAFEHQARFGEPNNPALQNDTHTATSCSKACRQLCLLLMPLLYSRESGFRCLRLTKAHLRNKLYG